MNCTQLAANGTQYLTIDLSALELGGHLNASAWAQLPSLSEGLVSLNLSGNLLQVRASTAGQASVTCAELMASGHAAGQCYCSQRLHSPHNTGRQQQCDHRC